MAEFDLSLGKFNNSMNFAYGLEGSSIQHYDVDILNNPYVRLISLERRRMDGEKTYAQKYELEVCPDDELLRFVLPEIVEEDDYPQLLCFKNRDEVTILNNKYMAEHAFPVIATAYCRNTTENGNWCKSHEEVNEWLLSHRMKLIYQNTKFQKYIWEDNSIVEEHPYYGDKENYFPTIKSMVSDTRGAIDTDPVTRNESIPYDELYFGLNKMTISDSHIVPTEREGEFVNIVKTRKSKQELSSLRELKLDQVVEDLEVEEVLHILHLVKSNEGMSYQRTCTQIIDEIGNIGGLLEIALTVGLLIFLIFVEPFRSLDLALSFSALKTKISR